MSKFFQYTKDNGRAISILLVTRSLPFHHIGGMEAVAWDLARSFAKLGHSVTVLTTECEGITSGNEVDGVRIETLKVPSGRYSLQWWLKSRKVYVSKYEPNVDLVLSISAGALSFPYPKSSGPVFIAQIHGTAWSEVLSKFEQRSIVAAVKSIRNIFWLFRDFRYRRFDAFVGIGDRVHDDLRKVPSSWIMGSVNAKKIVNGIDTDLFKHSAGSREEIRRSWGIGRDETVLLSASRIHAQKGIVESLEGFSIALRSRPDLVLVIAGGGQHEGAVRARIHDLGLGNKVRMIGSVSREYLPKILSASDGFVFTSLRVEGLPLNILEALSSGLVPIVSNHLSGQGFPCVGVDPRNPDEIASAMVTVTGGGDRSNMLPREFSLSYATLAYLDLFYELKSKSREIL